MQRPSSFVNLADLDWTEVRQGTRFAYRRRSVGLAAGSQRLGASLYELMPGGESFPFHYHHANEEAILVLEGAGTVRTPDGEFAVGAGDYVAFPVGEAGAHGIRADADGPLRYLCVSTMVEPDVTRYPDSNKIGVIAGSAPGGDAARRTLTAFLPADAAVNYYHDEDDPPDV